MVDEIHELKKQGDTTNIWNVIVMGRESWLKNGLMLKMFTRRLLRMMYMISGKLKAIVKKISKLMKNVKDGDISQKRLSYLKKQMEIALSYMEKIDTAIVKLNKYLNSIKHDQTIEREILLKFIQRIVSEGFPKEFTIKIGKKTMAELRRREKDLEGIKASYSVLAGREKDYKMDAIIGDLKKLLAVGNIHSKVFWTRIGEYHDVNKLTKQHPKKYAGYLNDAIESEKRGNGEKVKVYLEQMLDELIKEDADFEDLQNDINTQLSSYIDSNRQPLLELNAIISALQKSNKDKSLTKVILFFEEFRKKFTVHNTKFADKILFFRRGNETAREKTRAMIQELNKIMTTVDRDDFAKAA